MSRVYRTRESLFNSSLESQVLDMFLFYSIEGIEYFSFDELMNECEDESTQEELLNVLISLIDDHILYESNMGFSILSRIDAHHRAGFYTEDTRHLATTDLICLTDRGEEMLENNNINDIAEYTAICGNINSISN